MQLDIVGGEAKALNLCTFIQSKILIFDTVQVSRFFKFFCLEVKITYEVQKLFKTFCRLLGLFKIVQTLGMNGQLEKKKKKKMGSTYSVVFSEIKSRSSSVISILGTASLSPVLLTPKNSLKPSSNRPDLPFLVSVGLDTRDDGGLTLSEDLLMSFAFSVICCTLSSSREISTAT